MFKFFGAAYIPKYEKQIKIINPRARDEENNVLEKDRKVFLKMTD